MTRKRLYGVIRTELERADIFDEDCMEVVDVSVDSALEYLLEFGMEVSAELASKGLYSQAMVAGVFIHKLKILLGEE